MMYRRFNSKTFFPKLILYKFHLFYRDSAIKTDNPFAGFFYETTMVEVSNFPPEPD
jgi:hypothetical protein